MKLNNYKNVTFSRILDRCNNGDYLKRKPKLFKD